MDFSLNDYMDEDACHGKLVELLHPEGLACPDCGQRQRLGVHHRHPRRSWTISAAPAAVSSTPGPGPSSRGTHRRPSQILLILRGIATGQPTAQMARELGCDRKHLLELRHRLQEHARIGLDRNPLDDAVVEADEMYQNAGEKRHPAHRPGRSTAAACQPPPRSRDLRQRPPADRRGRGAGHGRVPLGSA